METVNRFNIDRSSAMIGKDLPEAILEMIQQQIVRLRTEYDRILDCQVSTTVPAFSQSGIYQIRIAISLPDQNLTIDRAPIPDCYQEDIYVAIWSAFDLARKKLKAHSIPTDCGVNVTTVENHFPQISRTIRRCRGYAQG